MTIDVNAFLTFMLYFCLIILVILFIYIGIKLIKVLSKADMLLDTMQKKMDQVDGVFEIIGKTSGYANRISDRIIDAIAGFIGNMFRKKKGRIDDEEE